MRQRTRFELAALAATRVANSDGGNPREHAYAARLWSEAAQGALDSGNLRRGIACLRLAVRHTVDALGWERYLNQLYGGLL